MDSGDSPTVEQLERLLHAGSTGSAPVRFEFVQPASAPAGPVSRDGVPHSARSSGSTYDPTTGRFALGVGVGAATCDWALHTPGRGMEHGLIAGRAGSGRTDNLRMVLVAAIQARHFEVMVADPLDRRLCDAFAPVARALARSRGETVDLLEGAVRAVDDRLAARGHVEPGPERPAILLAIDDAEAVLCDQHAAALAAQIVTRGGPAGVGLVAVTGSVDPADFAGNTELLLGLQATNALLTDLEYAYFLHAFRASSGPSADLDA
jgi:hypothetical protein